MLDPNLLRAKGRLVKSRIRNEMDGVWQERGSWRQDLDLREIQSRQRCKVCHEEGHNRRRCPNSCGALTSSSCGALTSSVLQTRQVLSLFLYNMLIISFAFCSSHLGTNDRILMFFNQAETRFWNGIVRGSYGCLRYGQVLGDYVDYIVLS